VISIKFDNLPQVRAHVAKVKARLKNTRSTNAEISIMFDAWVQRNFKEQGGKVGGWKKLAAGGRWKGKGKSRKFDTSAKLLQDTGRLRASFIPFASITNAGIGSELPYAKAHDEGKGVPKRRILMLMKEVRGDIIKKYNIHVKESLR